MSHRNCKSCVHSDGSACLSILNTGHRRPCPASNGCEVWEADHGQYLKQRRAFSLVSNESTIQEQDARADVDQIHLDAAMRLQELTGVSE